MFRVKTIVAAALVMLAALLLPQPTLTSAIAAGAASGAEALNNHDAELKAEYEVKSAINDALLESARKISAPSNEPEAEKYMKMAEAAAEEGRRHYRGGDYAFAVEDLAESTRMAVYAILISEGDGESLREKIVREEMLLHADREHELKEKRIRRGILDAETFINAADRLLVHGSHPEAEGDLSRAKELLRESKAALADEKYDEAITKLNSAYKLSSGSVSKIKRSQNEPITFPRPDEKNREETFSYELRKNNTYRQLAAQLSEDAETAGTLRKADRLHKEAEGARKDGRIDEAIEKLRESTGLLIPVITADGN